jgi:hypothetical protein
MTLLARSLRKAARYLDIADPLPPPVPPAPTRSPVPADAFRTVTGAPAPALGITSSQQAPGTGLGGYYVMGTNAWGQPALVYVTDNKQVPR